MNTLTPLTGKPDDGVGTGSMFPELDATTTADEVDGSFSEVYAGGFGAKSEYGACCPIDESTTVLLSLGVKTHVFLESHLLFASALEVFLIEYHRGRSRD